MLKVWFGLMAHEAMIRYVDLLSCPGWLGVRWFLSLASCLNEGSHSASHKRREIFTPEQTSDLPVRPIGNGTDGDENGIRNQDMCIAV